MSWFFDELTLALSFNFIPELLFTGLCDLGSFVYTHSLYLLNTDFFFSKAVRQLFNLTTVIMWSTLVLVTVVLCKISSALAVTTSKTNGVSSSSSKNPTSAK